MPPGYEKEDQISGQPADENSCLALVLSCYPIWDVYGHAAGMLAGRALRSVDYLPRKI